uniref:Uncharacterized protein n=1 Tax=Strongyloides stercoralis TaxID=6248 RepID=A0A0K0ELN8_STRER
MKVTFNNPFSSIHLIVLFVLLLTIEETFGFFMMQNMKGGRDGRHLGTDGSGRIRLTAPSSSSQMRSGGGRQNKISYFGR